MRGSRVGATDPVLDPFTMLDETTSPGERLKRIREAKGISIRQIADATKISARWLECVEREDLSKLPGGIFARAIIRSYAAHVGLDGASVLAEFVEAHPATLARAAKVEPVDSDLRTTLMDRLPFPSRLAAAVTLAVCCVAAGYWVFG